MTTRKNIFVIIGSASAPSANQRLVDYLAAVAPNELQLTVFNGLKNLPHFDPAVSAQQPPKAIVDFREAVAQADGVIICTPEYIFSIPSGLKNALEWCVATTVFTDKPVGLITASAHGQKGHEELQLIMKTLMASFTAETTLLIQGVKGKVHTDGTITDAKTKASLDSFIQAFKSHCMPA